MTYFFLDFVNTGGMQQPNICIQNIHIFT